MKHALLILLIVTFAVCVAFAGPSTSPTQANLAGSGNFSASAVLWFSGTNVTAQVSGTMSLNGSLSIGDNKRSLKARGTLTGGASGDSNTMIGGGWATFTARGTLDSGEAITLRGAINLSADDVDLSSDTAGSGTGSLYIVLMLPDQTLRMRGEATGTAGGGFVTPDDPHTMQVEGSGSFTFTVVTREATTNDVVEQETPQESVLSWNPADWPQEMHEQFIRMMQEELE